MEPKRVFIVPYRNRLEQKFFFSKQMNFILEDASDYEIYFSHQCDNRNFNRGACRNIGFLAMKEKYPTTYKDITFIFNDVDTLPFHKIFDYQTRKGVVKHYYGFEHALGGIVVIKGSDFEAINGYPNYWGWGNEDNVLESRCKRNHLIIDRSQFYKVGSPEILQLFDGVARLITPNDVKLNVRDDGSTGLTSIHRLTFSIDNESLNPVDNKYVVDNERIKIVNILSFLTELPYERNNYYEYDIRDASLLTSKQPQLNKTDKRVEFTSDWKNFQLKAINGFQQQQPMPRQPIPLKTPPNKYSPQYANYIGVKPRAVASANVPMGRR